MINDRSGLPSNDEAESCIERAQRYRQFAAAAHCGAVREALEEAARACVRAAGEARMNAYQAEVQIMTGADSLASRPATIICTE